MRVGQQVLTEYLKIGQDNVNKYDIFKSAMISLYCRFFVFKTDKYQIKMTKANIIEEIVNSTGIAKKDVSATVEAFMEVIKNSLLEKKENVYLRGFGSFIVKHRAEKTARNISKNTTIVIAAHDFPSFKPAKSFVAQMRGEQVVEEED